MDQHVRTQESFQKVIDCTNNSLAIWKSAGKESTFDEKQSLFLSNFRRYLTGNYGGYSTIVRAGRPLVSVKYNRVSSVYCSVDWVQQGFSKCDYDKEMDLGDYASVPETIHHINFNSITNIKFS